MNAKASVLLGLIIAICIIIIAFTIKLSLPTISVSVSVSEQLATSEQLVPIEKFTLIEFDRKIKANNINLEIYSKKPIELTGNIAWFHHDKKPAFPVFVAWVALRNPDHAININKDKNWLGYYQCLILSFQYQLLRLQEASPSPPLPLWR